MKSLAKSLKLTISPNAGHARAGKRLKTMMAMSVDEDAVDLEPRKANRKRRAASQTLRVTREDGSHGAASSRGPILIAPVPWILPQAIRR